VARKSSAGGLYVHAGVLDIENLIKPALLYSVSYFNLGVLVLCFWGLSPPKGLLWNLIRFHRLTYSLFAMECLFADSVVSCIGNNQWKVL